MADQMRAWGLGDLECVDDVLLVTSELLGNAIRYCVGEDIGVVLTAHEALLGVAVSDNHPGDAVVPGPPEDGSLAEGGRGLLLVEALSESWGQRRAEGRKTVWCVFALPAGSGLTDHCQPDGAVGGWPRLADPKVG